MTIKLKLGLNSYNTIVSSKNESGLYDMELKNLQTNERIIYNIVDLSPINKYITFTLDIEDTFKEGEYVYRILNNSYCIRCGLAKYGEISAVSINYTNENKNIVYGE